MRCIVEHEVNASAVIRILKFLLNYYFNFLLLCLCSPQTLVHAFRYLLINSLTSLLVFSFSFLVSFIQSFVDRLDDWSLKSSRGIYTLSKVNAILLLLCFPFLGLLKCKKPSINRLQWKLPSLMKSMAQLHQLQILKEVPCMILYFELISIILVFVSLYGFLAQFYIIFKFFYFICLSEMINGLFWSLFILLVTKNISIK